MGWHLQSWEFTADVQCHRSSLEDSITHGKVIILQQCWERFLTDFLCARRKLGWRLQSNLLEVRSHPVREL